MAEKMSAKVENLLKTKTGSKLIPWERYYAIQKTGYRSVVKQKRTPWWPNLTR